MPTSAMTSAALAAGLRSVAETAGMPREIACAPVHVDAPHGPPRPSRRALTRAPQDEADHAQHLFLILRSSRSERPAREARPKGEACAERSAQRRGQRKRR